MTAILRWAISAALLTAVASAAQSQMMLGKVDDDQIYGSSQLTLLSPVDLKAGDRLTIALTGSAARVVVRLLPVGEVPQKDRIIIEDRAVVANGVVTITLKQDFSSIVAISVHGAPKPWNKYDLGIGNGPAFITNVTRTKRTSTPE